MKNNGESRRPDGEGGIVIIRKFSLGRRRGGVICVLRCQFGHPVILIELGHHGPQPSPERHDESADANIVSRQILARRLAALR
jgi:hypothetical protein